MWGTGDPALKLDLVLLEENPYTRECWDSDKACHFDESLVLVAVHNSLLPRAPEVIGFLQEWEFTINIYKGIFQWMDSQENATPEDAARWWLSTNSDIWGGWVTDEAAGKSATLSPPVRPRKAGPITRPKRETGITVFGDGHNGRPHFFPGWYNSPDATSTMPRFNGLLSCLIVAEVLNDDPCSHTQFRTRSHF